MREEWKIKYELAKIYFEHNGNLEIPRKYKTKNGYEYDEDGIALGVWLGNIRQNYKKDGHGSLTSEEIELLDNIGMRFKTKNNDNEWKRKYCLAKKYYEHYGNLEIPFNFKTKNGYEYDETGIALGVWLNDIRRKYKKDEHGSLTTEEIQLLKEIGMRFKTKNNDDEWKRKYCLAKKYYEYYGNLEIQKDFKTKNGYDYDEDGEKLGTWVLTQKQAYNGNGTATINEEKVKLLNDIGINWSIHESNWNKMFELAKKYYEHYGNSEVPQNFKTKNGYGYDDDGETLGTWINTQKQAYKGQVRNKLTDRRIKLLLSIKFNFNVNRRCDEWKMKYCLAKKYYEYNGNLKIPKHFKTTNGYEYDENGEKLGVWISIQRQAYKGKGSAKISDEQIKLLDEIDMIWFDTSLDEKLQSELIEESNTKNKKVEILNRFKSYLLELENITFDSKKDIDNLNDNFKKYLKL